VYRYFFEGFDENGSPQIEKIEGSERILKADAVIFAIGQKPNLPFASEGFEQTKAGTLRVDPETLAASKEGVFAGGDVVTGTKFIVDAIAAGYRAALSIQSFLTGAPLKQKKLDLPVAELTERQIKERIRNTGGRLGDDSSDFTEEEAVEEALRCLNCGICSECLQCVEFREADALLHDEPY